MKLINATPHKLEIYNEQREHLLTLEPSGAIARCKVDRCLHLEIDRGTDHEAISVYSTKFGALEGLPEPKYGEVIFVASMVAAQAAKSLGRTDVVSPGELLRNEQGQPIGCIGLSLP